MSQGQVLLVSLHSQLRKFEGQFGVIFFSIIEKEKEKEEKIFRKVVWVWKSKSKRSKTGVRKEPEEVNLQCNTTILCDSVIATNGEKMHE